AASKYKRTHHHCGQLASCPSAPATGLRTLAEHIRRHHSISTTLACTVTPDDCAAPTPLVRSGFDEGLIKIPKRSCGHRETDAQCAADTRTGFRVQKRRPPWRMGMVDTGRCRLVGGAWLSRLG